VFKSTCPLGTRYRFTTVVTYGAPYVGDGVINDPFLKTLIRVMGEYDSVPLQDLGQTFQIEDANGNVRPVENQYNIEILGAGHLDFSCASGPNQNECSDFINQQTSLFMRELNLVAARGSAGIDEFLNERTDGCVEKINDIYKINLDKFISRLRNTP